MFEYGGGVSEGPAGQVGGSGAGGGGANLNWGAQLMDGASDAVRTIAALPAEQLLLLAVGILVGLWVLRKAL